MRVKLKERRTEAPETMSFIFDLGGRVYKYRPGQFAFFNLDRLEVPDEKGKERHFTLSSSPTEKGLVMFTTRLRGSGYKETLRRAPLGTVLTLEAADGDFVLPDDASAHHVFIAGGIGITPFRSMLRQAADRKTPLRAHLFYLNRSVESVIFGRELEEFRRSVEGFSFELVFDEGPGSRAKGGDTLHKSDVGRLVKDAPDAHFWVSGPPAMVEAYAGLLGGLGVAEDLIHAEELQGYQPGEVFARELPERAARPPAPADKGTPKDSGPGLSFKADILPMFRKFEIDSMKPVGIDLASYDQVRKSAQKIHGVLAAHKMPCDKPWSEEKVAKFKRWMDGGAKP
jgi:ferredoxin-NADP reductase